MIERPQHNKKDYGPSLMIPLEASTHTSYESVGITFMTGATPGPDDKYAGHKCVVCGIGIEDTTERNHYRFIIVTDKDGSISMCCSGCSYVDARFARELKRGLDKLKRKA